MKILALESSAAAASAAVCEGETLIAQNFQRTGLTHSATLLPMVESMLDNAGLSLDEIDLFAAAVGPGSFTGLRIGVSALKGLAWGTGKPCASCSTLESMAWQAAHMEGWELYPVMDARRGQVYHARFLALDGQPVRLTDDGPISLEALCAQAADTTRPRLLLGDGAVLCAEAMTQQGLEYRLAPPHLLYQTAWGVARCALSLSRQAKMTTAEALIPQYHRLSQAERERACSAAGKDTPKH